MKFSLDTVLVSPTISFAVGFAGVVGVMTSLVTVVFDVPLVVPAASLNPLSPFPGMAFPLRESWFLFSFSSFLSVVAFGILSTTKAWLFNSLETLSTSVWVALSFDSRA